MDVRLQSIAETEKSVLVRLMELFLYDFSVYSGEDVNEHGCYGYAHIDDYWNEAGRFPYLIRADGKIAGFALVCPHCSYRAEPEAKAVGEFFVMRKYRRKGVGAQAAAMLFDAHPGLWEVCYWQSNLPAAAFWQKVVGSYTQGQYRACGGDADKERGLLFENR